MNDDNKKWQRTTTNNNNEDQQRWQITATTNNNNKIFNEQCNNQLGNDKWQTTTDNDDNQQQQQRWTKRTNDDDRHRRTMTTATANNEDKQWQRWGMQFACIGSHSFNSSVGSMHSHIRFFVPPFLRHLPPTMMSAAFSSSKGLHNSRLMPQYFTRIFHSCLGSMSLLFTSHMHSLLKLHNR